MAIESQNIYKNARKSAGFTQEKASQLLNVSVDSLRDYEQSQRPVPSDVASAMCDVYQAPYLAVQHLRLTSDLGKRVVPEIQLKDLPEAVLGVLAAVQRFCAKREAMVEIAADGQIAESEQAEWDEIMCLANDLNVAIDAKVDREERLPGTTVETSTTVESSYLIVERLERLLTDVQRQKSKVIQQLADLRRMSNSGKNELVDDWVAAVEAADTEAEDADDGTETT